MFHASYYRPRIYPVNGDIDPVQIDRLQNLASTPTLNREKIREIGRDGIVDWRKRIPTTTVTAMQYEYGDLEFWRKITNQPDADTSITLTDFKDAMFDIAGYKTDDAGTFKGTVVYPSLRTSGFSINVGDPQAYIERNFDFVGEDEDIYENNNKYYNYKKYTATGATPETITVTSPYPAEDPEHSGAFLLRVTRYRPSTGVTTVLTYKASAVTSAADDVDKYSYNSSSKALIIQTVASDIIKTYFSGTSFICGSGTDVFVNNDTDASALCAENASIWLYVSSNQYVYKLQSVALDVTFDRTDYYEIGNTNIIQRGVRENTVRVTLGRILDAYTIEEVMRGVGSTYGHINTRNYIDNATLRLKIYTTSAKGTFAIGFKSINLSPVSFDATVPVNEYITRNAVLESDNLTISTVEGTIDA